MPLVYLEDARGKAGGVTSRVTETEALTALDAQLVACTRCAKVWPLGKTRCDRCGAPLESRDLRSLQRVWAWWIVGVFTYIPANLYPMLETRTLFTTDKSTIVGGAIKLATSGAPGVAIVVIVASVLIPIGKFIAIAYLAISVRRRSKTSGRLRQQMYEVVEYIGRWSMIDVFVVAILSSLVQLKIAASISPGPAAITFALSVVFTMLSAQSFDSRMIWDRIEEDAK